MKNGMIRIGMFEAYLERMLIRGLKVAYISYFTRTLQEAKAIASTMCTTEQNTIWLNNNGPEKRYNVVGTYKAYYVPIMRGKERFYHGVILNAAIGNELFVSKEETAGEELYEILMKKYPLPLLKWWGKPILSYALKEGLINAYSNRLYTECIETEYSLQGTLTSPRWIRYSIWAAPLKRKNMVNCVWLIFRQSARYSSRQII